jgi:hypothetical protein
LVKIRLFFFFFFFLFLLLFHPKASQQITAFPTTKATLPLLVWSSNAAAKE